MAEDSGGGGPSWAFGSRYEGLQLDQLNGNEIGNDKSNEWHQKSNRNKKRTANRDGHNENQYTKTIKVDKNNGPRYLILTRTEGQQTMKNVSPFFIKKAMDAITPNVSISRTRDGGLLLKTVDKQQADKLMRQKILGGRIPISITDHPTLNTCRGQIYCPDLVMLTDEEIKEELQEAHVIEVRRKQKRNKQGEREDSGEFVLTFNLGYLPDSINAGFYLCKVRQYIPEPLRCFNCLMFGHKKDQCRGSRICAKCATLYHDGNPCPTPELKCVNCRHDHHALSRQCEIYKDEFEIQKIRAVEKISLREARRKRRLQTPNPAISRLGRTYAEATRNNQALTERPIIIETEVNLQEESRPTSKQKQRADTIIVEKSRTNIHHEETQKSEGSRNVSQHQQPQRDETH